MKKVKTGLPVCFGMLVWVLLSLPLVNCSSQTVTEEEFTRGIGIYPGDEAENFAPTLTRDDTYRNIALRRPAFHSSSYDYNLTAQLVVDGITDTELPRWVSTATSGQGVLPKNERVYFIDRHMQTSVDLDGPSAWMSLDIYGGTDVPVIDTIVLDATFRAVDNDKDTRWTATVMGSDDGENWRRLGRASGTVETEPPPTGRFRFFWRGNQFNETVALDPPASVRFYRVELEAANVETWSVREVEFFNGDEHIVFGGPHDFTSAWKSAGAGEEWVYVDLGDRCSFDRVVLSWIRRAAAGSIQISDDAETWETLASLPPGTTRTTEIDLGDGIQARYVRLLVNEPVDGDGYILSEMEIYGSGAPVAVPHPAPPVKNNGRLDLAGGNWRLQRASLVDGDGASLSRTGVQNDDWVVATVPGTVLVSYRNAGALPDPNFGSNQLMISDSFFYSDFWYRTEFTAPESYDGRRTHLNFDGVNWKAEIYLNGEYVGRIDGAFMRGTFDVTDILRPGETNALAVRQIKNDTPGHMKQKTFQHTDVNGGTLGGDNPTYHASIGWDWIPTIRGRNNGIWNDVYVTTSGPVTIEDPFLTTDLPLPDTTFADLNLELTLKNHTDRPVSGTLRGTIGAVTFEEPVEIAASSETLLQLNSTSNPSLRMENPKLWWPAGYGNPDLYDVDIEFDAGDTVSDHVSFKTGIREMDYSEDNGILRIWINGRRFFGRGGNWGFPESMLLYRGREYDTAVRYHTEMNFTMIRNWVGMTGDEEFFEACDRHGVMVWQDFWLANPVDGPDPYNPDLFLDNARDMIHRIRNHPSIGLYCGRNEGNPPEYIDNGLRERVTAEHEGLHYISNSAFGVVSGGGPYRAQPIEYYFDGRAIPKMHSEMGMPNIVTYESLRMMMPEESLWPMGLDWGLHDFTLEGAQGGVSFIERLQKAFGPIDNAKDWVTRAQWINYEGYRAMFESQSRYRMGLLLWMSHPCWPSFVWQTYDYYFEPTAGYFGSKKGTEPLHIQWNALTDSIEVVNYHIRNGDDLEARVELLNLDGSVQWEKAMDLECPEDSTVRLFPMEYPESLSSVYFMWLNLLQDGELVSENFYWRGLEEGDYTALNDLPQVDLTAETTMQHTDDIWLVTTRLANPTDTPALMVRLKVVREQSRDRILPVIYSDNYVFLMPGEERTVMMELEHADTRGEDPAVVVSGFNVAP